VKTTLAAKKLGLRPAITPINITASGAPLAGLTGVNHYNLTSSAFRFVLKESPELEERPSVQPSAGFPVIDLNPVSDVREVLKHDSSTCIHIPDNRGGDNVVAIPSESLLTTSEASKMPLGALRTVGLQCTPKTKYFIHNFLHVPVAMKAVVGTHGRTSHSQIHADCFPIGNKFNIGESDNHMKIKPILAENEVSGSGRITLCILGILGNIKGNLNPTTIAGKIHDALFPIQRKGMRIVARRATHGLRTTCFAPLLLSGNRRLNRFGSLLSGLNMQVRNETGESIFTITVGEVVKRVGITLMLFPTSPANDIKRFSKMPHRLIQSIRLFCRWLEKYPCRSIHIKVIPYIRKILQYKEVNRNSSVA
jgi:hypothetical protein